MEDLKTKRRELSSNVTVEWGFEDGHITVRVKLTPFGPTVPLNIKRDEIPLAVDALTEGEKWARENVDPKPNPE